MKRGKSEREYNYSFEEDYCTNKRTKSQHNVENEKKFYDYGIMENNLVNFLTTMCGGHILFAFMHLVIPTFSQVYCNLSKIASDSAFDSKLLETSSKRICLYAKIYSQCDRVLPKPVIPEHILQDSPQTIRYYEQMADAYDCETIEGAVRFSGFGEFERTFDLGICELDHSNESMCDIMCKLSEDANSYSNHAIVIPLCMIYARCLDHEEHNRTIGLSPDDKKTENEENGPIYNLLRNIKVLHHQNEDADLIKYFVDIASWNNPNIDLFERDQRKVEMIVKVFKSTELFEFLACMTFRSTPRGKDMTLEYVGLIVREEFLKRTFGDYCGYSKSKKEENVCNYHDVLGYALSDDKASLAIRNIVKNNYQNKIFTTYTDSHYYFTVDVADHLIANALLSKNHHYNPFSLVQCIDVVDCYDKLLNSTSLKWKRRLFHKSDECYSKKNYVVISVHQ